MLHTKKSKPLLCFILCAVFPLLPLQSSELRFSLETEIEKKQSHKEFTDLTGYQSKAMDELIPKIYPHFPMAIKRFDNTLPNLLLANVVLSSGSKWEKIIGAVFELAYTGRLPHSVIFTAAMELYNQRDWLSPRAIEIMVELHILAQVHADITDHFVKNCQINSCQKGPFEFFRSTHFDKWIYGNTTMIEDYPEACFRALTKLKKHSETVHVFDSFPLGFSTVFFENYRVRTFNKFSNDTLQKSIEKIYEEFTQEVQTTFPGFDLSSKRASEFDFSKG